MYQVTAAGRAAEAAYAEAYEQGLGAPADDGEPAEHSTQTVFDLAVTYARACVVASQTGRHHRADELRLELAAEILAYGQQCAATGQVVAQ